MLTKIRNYIKENGWFSIYLIITSVIGILMYIYAFYLLFTDPKYFSMFARRMGVAIIVALFGFISSVVSFIYKTYITKGFRKGALLTIIFLGVIILFSLCIWGSVRLKDYYDDYENRKHQIAKENYEKSILEKAEEEYYQSIKSEPTTEKCSHFLTHYFDSNHCNEVLEIYYYCALNTDLISLNKIAEEYSKTKWGEKAKEVIKHKSDSLYRIAIKDNTLEGWNKYRETVPINYYSDSDKKIIKLKEALWRKEPYAWSFAVEANNLESYERYQKLHPHGAHIKEAERKIIDFVYAIGKHDLQNVASDKVRKKHQLKLGED